jgi:pfkB family carbohydrate kinase
VKVIVVAGDIAGRVDASGEAAPAGFAATVATAAAAAGSKVELVTRIGEDAAGDAIILALARAGIGHVATLRDAGRRTPVLGSPHDEAGPDLDDDATSTTAESPPGPMLDGGDVGLALRYLSDYRVIVVAHAADRDLLDEVVTAAGWSGARLVVVASPGIEVAVPNDAIVIEAEADAEAVAVRVGRYAAAIDRGGEPDTAYAVLTGANAES